MSNERTVPPESNEFASKAAKAHVGGFLSEYWYFLRHNKKWWLTPIILLMVLLSVLVVLGGSGGAPFIYTLF